MRHPTPISMSSLPRRRRLNFLLLGGLLGFSSLVEAQAPLAASPAANAAKPIFEEWTFVTLGGKRCGYSSTVTVPWTTSGGSGYRTTHEECLVVKRLGALLKMLDISEVVEDAQGTVLSFTESSSGAGSSIETNGRREGEELVVSSRGQTVRYFLPRQAALGPEAIRRLANALPLRAGQTYSFRTFSTDDPQEPVIENGIVEGNESRQVRGTARRLWRLTSETKRMPGVKQITWVDDRAKDVETQMTIPGLGDLHEYVADRAECLRPPEGVEIFTTSFTHPNRALPALNRLATATYRLSTPGSSPLLVWDGDGQRVLSRQPGSCEIEVTVPTFRPEDAAWKLPHADSPEWHVYLQPTAYLETTAPEIKALARQAVGDEGNPVRAAARIEKFVENYIVKKDFNVEFASALETARSREGDCTEHAVLCAALGRAAGLPTRCVLGFGYIPPGVNNPTVGNAKGHDTGIFGFHMWAEAWVGPNQWMAMDAALDGFDAGHIVITKTALEEIHPLVELNAPILQLLEHLKITVLRTRLKPAS